MAYRLDRTVLFLSGPDAAPFLQNLATQDLDRLAGTPAVYAGLLSPQGKVLADFFIWRGEGGLWLEADAARGPDLLRRLSMFKLRAAVTIEDKSDAVCVLAGNEDAPPGAIARAPDPRLPALGWRALAPQAPTAPEPLAAYHAARIAAGVPDLVQDASPEEAFALEALFEELNGVDFHKGCFVGQENVSRMKRRATTRRKFCRIAFDGEAPAYGAPVQAGEVVLGAVRSSAAGKAIALLRLDRALAAASQGTVLAAAGAPIRLDPPDWLILPGKDT